MSEFDSIDDELFSLDYLAERQLYYATGLPEPATVRLAPAFGQDVGRDETSGEVAIVIGFGILLVVVLATTGLVLWW